MSFSIKRSKHLLPPAPPQPETDHVSYLFGEDEKEKDHSSYLSNDAPAQTQSNPDSSKGMVIRTVSQSQIDCM